MILEIYGLKKTVIRLSVLTLEWFEWVDKVVYRSGSIRLYHTWFLRHYGSEIRQADGQKRFRQDLRYLQWHQQGHQSVSSDCG